MMSIILNLIERQKLKKSEREKIYKNNKNMVEIAPDEQKSLSREKTLHDNALVTFQRDRVKDQRKLMWVGIGIGAVGILAAGAMAAALIVLLPLKETKPYIVSVDQVTGSAGVVSAIGDDKIKLTYQNLIDANKIASFVVSRESYDWNSIQSNLDMVKLNSTHGVYEAMRRFIVESDNSPLQLLGKDKIMKVGVVSRPIVNSNDGSATVRFYKAITDESGKVVPGYPVTHWLATITFDYDHPLKTDEDKLQNPLGFNVNSYRVDQETQK
jgi:type IV secretion system protein VirB8